MVIICNIESGLNVTVFIAICGAPWLQEYSLFKPGPLLRFSLVAQVYNGYLNSCPCGEPRLWIQLFVSVRCFHITALQF